MITRVGRREIEDADDLSQAISEYGPGEEARLEVHRGDRTQTVKVRLGSRPLAARGG